MAENINGWTPVVDYYEYEGTAKIVSQEEYDSLKAQNRALQQFHRQVKDAFDELDNFAKVYNERMKKNG